LADIAAVADSFRLTNPAVVGESLGGMIASMWAREHPECPAAVNLDGHGMGRPDQYLGLDETRVSTFLDGFRAAFLEQAAAADVPLDGDRVAGLLDQQRAMASRMGIDAALAVEMAERRLSTVDGRTWLRPRYQLVAELGELMGALDLIEIYGRIDCPFLLVNATESLPAHEAPEWQELRCAYQRGLGREFARLAGANSRFRVIDFPATHLMVQQRPRLLAERVGGFLADAAAGGGS
jgi:pimeloyl-ACP methyl ester carboxylesterase